MQKMRQRRNSLGKYRFLLFLVLVSLLIVPSCSSVKTMTFRDGKYVISSGLSYVRVENEYSPVTRGEVYATLKLKYETVTLYSVDGLSPKSWLCSEDGTLYRNENETLPSPEEMHFTSAQFIQESTGFVRHTLEDRDLMETILSSYLHGESIPYVSGAADSQYTLRFLSESFPCLYYSIEYIEYSADIHVQKEISGADAVSEATSYPDIVSETYSETDEEGVLHWYADCNYGRVFVYNTIYRNCVPLFSLLEGELS